VLLRHVCSLPRVARRFQGSPKSSFRFDPDRSELSEQLLSALAFPFAFLDQFHVSGEGAAVGPHDLQIAAGSIELDAQSRTGPATGFCDLLKRIFPSKPSRQSGELRGVDVELLDAKSLVEPELSD
jgi:hypothetical protein